MNTILKRALSLGFAVTSVALLSNTANADYSRKYCYVQTNMTIKPVLKPYFKSSESKIISEVKTTQNKIMEELKALDAQMLKDTTRQADYITNAISVLSQQKAMSTEQFNEAMKDNTQVQANAIQSINTNKRVQKAIREYGNAGIGYDVCNVHAKREDVKGTTESTEKAIQDMVRGEITARAGRYADRKEALATRLALHNKYYCTEGQAKSGMCDGTGERAGKSLMASTMFEPADYLSAEYNDKSAFINNMMGLPDDPVPQNEATSTTGQAYMDLKRRKDAIKSTAATSLKAIQADWSSVPAVHGGEEADKEAKEKANNLVATQTEGEQLEKDAEKTTKATDDIDKADANSSLMVQVKADVARYLGGGKEYEEWSKTLTGLEEKGILTEVLKVKALRLYIQSQEYQQLQRMEAMLAANVAAQTENSGMSGRVENLRQKAVSQRIKENLVDQ